MSVRAGEGYKKFVRRKVKINLSKYISGGERIGKNERISVAFPFSGEVNMANHGLVEFIDVLKSKDFGRTDRGEVVRGRANEPAYRWLQNNEFLTALCDRTR